LGYARLIVCGLVSKSPLCPPLIKEVGGILYRTGLNQAGHKEERMQRTLSIIKPDGVSKKLIGEVVRIFESSGFKIAAMKMKLLSRAEAEGFYYVHKERVFFQELVEFMISGPVVIMVLEGDDAIKRNREIMGATDPAEAEAGTIRAKWADSKQNNIVHGSDSEESAKFEIGYFFSGIEIF
jgi:nucleoside-diphosphate kinase